MAEQLTAAAAKRLPREPPCCFAGGKQRGSAPPIKTTEAAKPADEPLAKTTDVVKPADEASAKGNPGKPAVRQRPARTVQKRREQPNNYARNRNAPFFPFFGFGNGSFFGQRG